MSAREILGAIWRHEPVLVRTVLPQLVNVGVLTSAEFDLVSKALAALVALVSAVVSLVGGFRARSKVRPVQKG